MENLKKLERRMSSKLAEGASNGMVKALNQKMKLAKFEEKQEALNAIPIVIYDILTDPNNYYVDYLSISEVVTRVSGLATAYLEGKRAIEKDVADTLDETALFPLGLLRFLNFDPILFEGEKGDF